MSRTATESKHQRRAPAGADSSGPDSPTDLTRASWVYVARKTVREFSKDQCTDLAAALTYYAVLAMFPATVALLSLVGVFGQGTRTVDTLLGVVSDAGGSSVAQTLRPILETLSRNPGAGLALILGLLGALWSASRYVGAFARAMNRIYEIGEGRPVWKLRPVMLLVTLVLVVLVAVAVLALIVSGPLTQSLGNALGLGSAAVLAWRIAKWPVLLVVAVVIVATLYYATPNVKQTKFRWLSIGALVAIVVWGLLSLAFGFYVANFSSYDKTYGALAGVIVFLLWLWLTNLALLFGAELDAELERGRELQSGVAAENTIQLPARDTRNIDKAESRHADDAQRGRELRNQARENDGDPDQAHHPLVAALPHPPRPGRDTTHHDRHREAYMAKQQEASKAAKILYRPIGLTSSILGGLLAGIVFKQVWRRATPGDRSDPPTALESQYDLKEILIAATVQGAIFSLVKTLIDRGGARAFQRWTGEWPGS